MALRGRDTTLDVTNNNVIAAARPLTLGIGLNPESHRETIRDRQPWLTFREMTGERRLLAEIKLCMVDTLPLGEEQLCLYTARSCRNFCVPRGRLWMRYLYDGYRQLWSEMRSRTPTLRMPVRELHCVFAFYICPRPVVLVSVVDGNLGNIFPMDLIGPVGTQHFTLALHNDSPALPLMVRSRRIALSNVPVSYSAVAFELGKNHKKASVDWGALPFATKTSTSFGLPVPQFASRVRDMQIETVRTLGSHTLFVARTIEDHGWAEGLQLFQIHGFYQAWRQQLQQPHLTSS
ncbi:MAG: flavin reductase family protein [Acidobacteriia bacterium]|nr:flavin reductase family protein [Terriglobia bacterium]